MTARATAARLDPRFSPIGPDEASEIIALYRSYMNTPQTPERIARLVSEFPSQKVTIDGRLVGFCYTNSFAPDVLEVCNIFVLSEYQNLGLGRRIIERIHELARAAGFVSTILSNSDLYDTNYEKRSPQAFYERQGYRVILSTPHTRIFARSL